MRRLVLILGGLVIGGLCAVIFFSGSNGNGRTLSDGSVVRIEKVTVALVEDDDFVLGGIAGKLKHSIREFWANAISHSPPSSFNGSWSEDDSKLHTNVPALYVYISRRVPRVGYRSVDSSTGFLIDEDGCVFQSTQAGGIDDGQIAVAKNNRSAMNSDIGWFRFEAFPRHDKKFRFVFVTDPMGLGPAFTNMPTAEFLISNPAKPPQPASWSVEPIPIKRDQGGVSFTLASVKMLTNPDPNTPSAILGESLYPEFACAENGKPSTNWQAIIEEFSDVGGNFATLGDDNDLPPALCPREAAWRLRVKFFGSENSSLASNAVWALPRIAVPGLTNSVPLSFSNTLQGASIRLAAIGGAGNFIYSNAIVLHVSPLSSSDRTDWAHPLTWPSGWTGSNSVLKPTFKLVSHGPHLALAVDKITADQRLTIRCVDDQGRTFYGRTREKSPAEMPPGPNYLKDLTDESSGSFVFLDLPVDAKTVELTFCVHTCRSAEFIFKPPQSNASRGK